MPLLTDYDWRTKYDPDDGSLIGQFYLTALACALAPGFEIVRRELEVLRGGEIAQAIEDFNSGKFGRMQ